MDTTIIKAVSFEHLVEEPESPTIQASNVNRPKIEPQTSNEPSDHESVGIGSELVPLKESGINKQITSFQTPKKE